MEHETWVVNLPWTLEPEQLQKGGQFPLMRNCHAYSRTHRTIPSQLGDKHSQ